ncbi:ParB/RepB/Spo0J family partition protein [Gleimia hominis]|uniref:ParB/RepB/Spo0J family partition protein n=1 Tax=Gleimia hominis TaxID=595468 RepID=A0ABU3I8S7_9ACTO|nr:ParB/RepB/Spo0J family partition protein [Gleimia hominis]MDT3766782.1 ParB/RepB/Spo0J family partition protein [Gleimia hominis]
MAEKSRRALGRGLGSLIPTREENVSRETISHADKPRDVFFPAADSTGNGQDGIRRTSALAQELLKPSDRRKKKASKTNEKKTTRSFTSNAKKTPKLKDADGVPPNKGADSKIKQAQKPKVSSEASTNVKTGNKEAQLEKRDTKANGKAKRDSSARKDGSTVKANETTTTMKLSGNGFNGQSSQSTTDDSELVPVPGASFAQLDVDVVIPNVWQPRQVFDEDELAELSESIAQMGVLQPVVVRPIADLEDPLYEDVMAQRRDAGLDSSPQYELIMGERRLRAAKLAGLESIPAIVRDTDDTQMLREALLENLHRSQLNPVEEASAYRQLLDDFGCTQAELSAKIARSRSQIANTLRLLKLPTSVQLKLASGVISAGHARALLGLESKEVMERLADRIISEGLSVRTTEEIVALGEVSSKVRSKRKAPVLAKPLSANASAVVDRLTDIFDTRVSVVEGKKKGRIVVEFAGEEDLARLTELIGKLKARD